MTFSNVNALSWLYTAMRLWNPDATRMALLMPSHIGRRDFEIPLIAPPPPVTPPEASADLTLAPICDDQRRVALWRRAGSDAVQLSVAHKWGDMTDEIVMRLSDEELRALRDDLNNLLGE